MARRKPTAKSKGNWRELLAGDQDWMRSLVREVVQEVLEAEMEEALQAGNVSSVP